MQAYRYVVLGGGMVAGYAARTMVEKGLGAGELCIVSSDTAPPYERPPLSKKYLAGQTPIEKIFINPADYYQQHGIELRLGTVGTVDFGARRIVTNSRPVISYQNLLIATGAASKMLNIPGSQLEGVCYLRSLADSNRIRGLASRARHAVVTGGGFIGMEVSAVLAGLGLETTLVVSGDSLQPRLFTPQMAHYFEEYYRSRGVTVLHGARLVACNGSERLTSVALGDGHEIPADLLVLGVGAQLCTPLFKNTPLLLNEGILVDEFLQTNLHGVYAAGDVTEYYDIIFKRQRHVEHWNHAVESGRHAARVMMGEHEPYRQLPYFFSDEFDLSWEFWGDTAGSERVLYRGDVEEGSFSTWWLKSDCLVAAFVMNRPDTEREVAQQWITSRKPVPQGMIASVEMSLPESS